jgi:4-hydroxy-4-methyl-2-oxoglutarate aldolase
MPTTVSPEILARLAAFGSSSIADAIETFHVRLRNEGFNDPSIRSFTPEFPPIVGYAATLRVRSAEPPMKAAHYLKRTEWWYHLQEEPAPKVVVIEDLDPQPGRGALAGGMHAAVLGAMGCVAIITNGAIRGLPTFRERKIAVFARNLSVSHAYGRVVGAEVKVNLAGVEISPGDLIHADLHGLVNVPLGLAARLPEVAARVDAQKKRIIDFCASADFSTDGLREIVHESISEIEQAPIQH